MNQLFLAIVFTSIQSACAIEIRVPEGWSQAEVPSEAVPYKMPPPVRPMIRLSPPDKDGSASIGQMKVTMSLNEASQRYTLGMPMRGITIDSTAKMFQNGHEGRHIKGHLSMAGNPNKIPVSVYIIMTPECILSIEAVSTKASTMINDVLSWIVFEPVTEPAKK